MKKIHVLAVALVLAVAAVFGTMAATRTAGLGAPARQDALVQQRTKQLDAFESSLRKQLTRTTARIPAAAPSARVVYHRPPPIVVTTHSGHGDDGGHESEHETSDD